MAGEGEQVKRRVLAAAATWASQAGSHLVGEAQRRAPIREGALRASGHADVTVAPGVGVGVEVTFDEVYAEVQHEGVGFDHPKGGEAKYLENALKENLGRYEATLAAAVRRAL